MAQRAIRVLLVEDNGADAELALDMLALTRSPRCEATHVTRLADAHAQLSIARYAVALLDLGLPDASGLAGLRSLCAASPATAIIVLSGLGDERRAVEALECGATDYLVKGRADGDTLQRSIRFALARRDADAAQRRFTAIVESSEDAILTMDLDAIITSWNPGAERVFGYKRAEAVGRPAAMLVPADRGHEEREILARVLGGHSVAHYETTRVCKDGGIRLVSLTVSAIRDADRSIVGVSSIARDITAVAHARESLQAAQERFRLAFEEAPIGMALLSLDARFIRANGALCAITGYRASELDGRDLASSSSGDDPGIDDEAMRALIDGEVRHLARECRFRHRSGRAVWVALDLTCVRDADDRPVHLLAQVQDVTERRRDRARLQKMADHDPLTGLLNRRAFERELEAQYARADGTALMIDLDRFKYYNDTLGHRAGDELIARIATALAGHLRKTDVLARLGGDEFAVLLPSADREGALRVAEGLLDCVRSEGLLAPDGSRRAVTASIGVAFFSDASASAPDDIMVHADLAMYDAKEAGRDRACVYQPETHESATMRNRMTWMQRIRRALDEDGFEMLAQPIRNLGGQAGPPRFELLLRMRDPTGALIAPGAFLAVAERLDLIQEIDRWVVAHATQVLARYADISVEVNLSGKSIGLPDLLTLTERLLRQHGVDPARLIFEITETAAVANIPLARSFSEHLAQLGCRFALDDFGTGFGSFYYLKHLPFDYLKIDGEFIRNVATDPTDRIVVAAVVEMARGLGKQTIAECVGDDATLNALLELGVDWGQGYHLGIPASLEHQLAAPV